MRPGDFAKKSSGRLRLIGCQLRSENPFGKLWPLLSFGEDNLPIAYNAASRFDGKWPDPLQNDRRAFLVSVGEHFSRLRDLRHEDQAFHELAVGLGEGL